MITISSYSYKILSNPHQHQSVIRDHFMVGLVEVVFTFYSTAFKFSPESVSFTNVMSKWPLERLLSGPFYLNFQSLLFTEEMVLMHVISLLYCWPNFIFSALSLSKYMSLLLNRINLFIITVFLLETTSLTVLPLAMYNLKTLFTYPS